MKFQMTNGSVLKTSVLKVWMCIAVLLLVNTSITASSGQTATMNIANTHRVIVKYRQEAAQKLDSQLHQGHKAGQIYFSGRNSSMNRKHRVKKIARIFPGFKERAQKMTMLAGKDKKTLSQREKHLSQRLKRASATAKVPNLDRIFMLEIDPNSSQSMEDILAAYQSDPDVEYAELDYSVSLCQIPTDPDYPSLWAMPKISAPAAWDIHTGSSDIIVAVIDTGVNYDHLDLQGNMWVNQVEANGISGVDDDNNGYIDDIHGYDFANDDGDPQDDHSHGTHIAGTIGARANNGIDVAGICWDISIMAIKMADPDTLGTMSRASVAIRYAVDNGADVLSNSWGMNPPGNLLKDAFDYATSQGVVSVAAAGNDSTSSTFYPAGYDNVISVAATTSSDSKAGFSNYGNWVDIGAPGVNILSLYSWGGTKNWQGTSMACPHISATCALMLSVNPTLTPDEVYGILMTTGDPIASWICKSASRVNVYEALRGVIPSSGYVRFESEFYSGQDMISIYLADRDLQGVETVSVVLTTAGGDSETVVLSETAEAIGVFRGSIATSVVDVVPDDGAIQVAHGEVVTATYQDSSDVDSNPAVSTDTATADCEGPLISNLEIDAVGPEPSITFDTDETATGSIIYSLTCDDGQGITRTVAIPTTNHIIGLPGVAPETDYYYTVEAVDRVGNVTVADNNGGCYSFTTSVDPVHVYVPGDYPTIQQGVDMCWEGGTVWIGDGTYSGDGNRDIDFNGKAITVRSVNGPENCIIDCQGSESDTHRGFYFHNRESGLSVLQGITIINGYQYARDRSNGNILKGGGILCKASSPTIRNCVLRNNYAIYGAGLFMINSSSVVEDCLVMANSGARGVGVWIEHNVDNGNPVFINCHILDNVANEYGGGIRRSAYGVAGCSLVLIDCDFSGNSAGYGGGGLMVSGEGVMLENCKFINNSAGNENWGLGGGIYSSSVDNMVIENNLFLGNKSTEYGGGFYCYFGEPDFVNCTFVGNSAPKGNAISLIARTYNQVEYIAHVDMHNCILWDGGNEIWYEDGATGSVSYSNVQGGCEGEGNIDNEPQFGVAWRLKGSSPCIDAGDNSAIADGDVDLAGRGRLFDGDYDHDAVVDMGVYEFDGAGADFDFNAIVDLRDYAILARHWLTDGCGDVPECCKVDLSSDGIVGIDDLSIFSWDWMTDYTLAGHWEFDETSGTTATDSSIYTHNGNLPNGGVWQPTGGRIAGALELDGVDDYVVLPGGILDPSESFSVMLWVKLETKLGTGSQVILQQEGATGRTLLYRRAGDDKLGSYFGSTASESETAVFATAGAWHHVGLTYDQATTTLKFYIDGQLDGSNVVVGEEASGVFKIGTHKDGANFDNNARWSGLIDDMRVYRRALTAGEVAGVLAIGSGR